jgi:hypothetical protein
MRSANHLGTCPPCSGRSALPALCTICSLANRSPRSKLSYHRTTVGGHSSALARARHSFFGKAPKTALATNSTPWRGKYHAARACQRILMQELSCPHEGLPLEVAQDFPSGIVAGRTSDAAPRVASRTAQIKTRDRAAIVRVSQHRAGREDLPQVE